MQTPTVARAHTNATTRRRREGEEDRKTHLRTNSMWSNVWKKTEYCCAHNRNWLSIVSVGFSCYWAVVAATKTSFCSFWTESYFIHILRKFKRYSNNNKSRAYAKQLRQKYVSLVHGVLILLVYIFASVFFHNTWICRIDVKKNSIWLRRCSFNITWSGNWIFSGFHKRRRQRRFQLLCVFYSFKVLFHVCVTQFYSPHCHL